MNINKKAIKKAVKKAKKFAKRTPINPFGYSYDYYYDGPTVSRYEGWTEEEIEEDIRKEELKFLQHYRKLTANGHTAFGKEIAAKFFEPENNQNIENEISETELTLYYGEAEYDIWIGELGYYITMTNFGTSRVSDSTLKCFLQVYETVEELIENYVLYDDTPLAQTVKTGEV
ncbi:MAG: hypothetical protein LIO62_09005 [Clostridiales bacterium]|nr:hypothetical protein [Clostridiales bacterium]